MTKSEAIKILQSMPSYIRYAINHFDKTKEAYEMAIDALANQNKVKPYGSAIYFLYSDKHKKEKLYRKIVDALVKNKVLEIYSNTDKVQTVYQ